MLFFNKIHLFFLLYLALTVSSSCGFKPLYSRSDNKKEIVGHLVISNIVGKEGFHLREELTRRFGLPKKDPYFLDVTLTTKKTNEIITPNNEITSYKLVMTALYKIRNKHNEVILQTQKSVARTGYSSAKSSTGYSTQVAEDDAKKRLAIKIGEKIGTQLSVLSEKWLK